MLDKNKKLSILISAPVFILILMLLIIPLPEMKEYSKVILADDATLLSAYLTSDHKWRMRAGVDDINPELLRAIIEKEDRWYYWHFGLNPVSIFRAFYSNVIKGKRVSGASTITMQVARLLQPAKRNYLSKAVEIFRSLQLELRYSKNDILKLYLSLLPYGSNIEGVKAASYIYFGRHPARLSLSQSIALACIPNDPNSRRPDKNSSKLQRARNYWINKFIQYKLFDTSILREAYDEPIYANRQEINPKAPHFCLYVKGQSQRDIIRTTLKPALQNQAETILSNHISNQRAKGISNGAVLIVDNKTLSVVAYCGSADFSDSTALGQVNGVTATRSPGSTLKPVLYAAMFDEGNLSPKMKLLDVPTDYVGYSPENFDLKYNGWVTAEFALRHSLNIPAVRLLRVYGFDRFISLLSNCGFSIIEKERKKLGLSMILGGCGVSLEQLVHLYSAFARGGEYEALKYYKMKHSQFTLSRGRARERGLKREQNRIISAESAYIISDILSSGERSETDVIKLDLSNLPRIAWKTGTSYGRRDAWAIGYNPKYTIGVWIGNFDGKGSPYLSGAETALPLLITLFNAIDYGNNNWFKKPDELGTREICSQTGLLPSSYCTHITTDCYIEKSTTNERCNLMKEVWIKKDSTVQYCNNCMPDEGYIKMEYLNYPAELVVWMISNKIPYKSPPPHNPECTAVYSSEGPMILTPTRDYEYYLERGSGQKVALQAASDANNKYHVWYVNSNYLAKVTSGDKAFFKPKEGRNKVTCMDDNGRNTSVVIKVKYF